LSNLFSVNVSMNKYQVLNKILHFLVLSASIGIFGRQAISCLVRYYEYETAISFHIQSTEVSTFPSFTICPAYMVAYKSDILAEYGLTVSSIRKNLEYPKVWVIIVGTRLKSLSVILIFARLRDCCVARLRDCCVARLRDCCVARLHDCCIARLHYSCITMLRYCCVARLCDCCVKGCVIVVRNLVVRARG
jgi:hypothetical protein